MAITGDSSDLFTSLPLSLAGANYSRRFESEADHYALQTMQRHHIATVHFANFLERLAKETGEKESDQKSPLKFLSTHPATYERIQAVREFETAKHPDQ